MAALLASAGFDLVHPFDAHAVARALGIAALHDPERPAGLLVGNTRAFWPVFLAARAADPELATHPDPIDRHVERTFAHFDKTLFAHVPHDGVFLPFQRIAEAAGFGVLSPSSHLLIHPTYGPWFALRAIVLAAGTPETRVLPRPACDCDRACGDAFARACETRAPDAWRAWLAVRDSCNVGREHRYGEDQIVYHYTKARLA